MIPNELQLACQTAVCHDHEDMRNSRLGCVIRRKDGTLVRSRNVAVHSGEKNNVYRSFPEAHAEARCARKADVGSVAYVARIRADGSIGMARPCVSCQAKLRARGVIKAYYTIAENEWGCLEIKSKRDKLWNRRAAS